MSGPFYSPVCNRYLLEMLTASLNSLVLDGLIGSSRSVIGVKTKFVVAKSHIDAYEI